MIIFIIKVSYTKSRIKVNPNQAMRCDIFSDHAALPVSFLKSRNRPQNYQHGVKKIDCKQSNRM